MRHSVASAFRRRLIPAQFGPHSGVMLFARHRFPALLLAVALTGAGIAAAAEPEAVTTAPATMVGGAFGAVPIGVADQIDVYPQTSPAADLPIAPAAGVTSGEVPRVVHGMVDVAVGSNGYRSAFVRSDLPIGKSGSVSIAVGETRFDGRGRSGAATRQSLALGLTLGDTPLEPRDPRCRKTGEDGSDMRLGSQLEGRHQRPCLAADAQSSR